MTSQTNGQLVSLERRKLRYEAELQAAGTDQRQRFWRACAWLLVEARHAGQLRQVTGWLLEKVHEVRTVTRYGGGRRAS